MRINRKNIIGFTVTTVLNLLFWAILYAISNLPSSSFRYISSNNTLSEIMGVLFAFTGFTQFLYIGPIIIIFNKKAPQFVKGIWIGTITFIIINLAAIMLFFLTFSGIDTL